MRRKEGITGRLGGFLYNRHDRQLHLPELLSWSIVQPSAESCGSPRLAPSRPSNLTTYKSGRYDRRGMDDLGPIGGAQPSAAKETRFCHARANQNSLLLREYPAKLPAHAADLRSRMLQGCPCRPVVSQIH